MNTIHVGHPRTRETMIKADLEPLPEPRVIGHAWWRKGWTVEPGVCLHPRRGQLDWWYRLNPSPRVNAATGTSKYTYIQRPRRERRLCLISVWTAFTLVPKSLCPKRRTYWLKSIAQTKGLTTEIRQCPCHFEKAITIVIKKDKSGHFMASGKLYFNVSFQ